MYIAKAAVVILSDAKDGSEEALGRAFTALASACDFKHKGDDVSLFFQGDGTRCLAKASPLRSSNG